MTTSGYGLGKNDQDYWDGNGKRWTYYANATESQCTLLIDGRNQRFDRGARGTVDQFLSLPETSFCGIDLTQAYAGVESVRREVLHQHAITFSRWTPCARKRPSTWNGSRNSPPNPSKRGAR